MEYWLLGVISQYRLCTTSNTNKKKQHLVGIRETTAINVKNYIYASVNPDIPGIQCGMPCPKGFCCDEKWHQWLRWQSSCQDWTIGYLVHHGQPLCPPSLVLHPIPRCTLSLNSEKTTSRRMGQKTRSCCATVHLSTLLHTLSAINKAARSSDLDALEFQVHEPGESYLCCRLHFLICIS